MGEFHSLTGYVDDPTVTLTVCLLIILGGLGFIVMNELYEYRAIKRVSLHTKIVLITSAFIVIVGTVGIFLLEYSNHLKLKPLTLTGKILGSLFQSVTARTAGANTLSNGDLTLINNFADVYRSFARFNRRRDKNDYLYHVNGAVWSQIRGKEDVIFYRQRIEYETIY